jgi:glycosyltransferase involved in cell wall biosynthesis
VRWAGRVPLVPCAAWRVPFGPLIRIPFPSPLPEPMIVHVHGLASLVPWSPFVGRPHTGPVVATLHGVLDRRLAVGVRGLRWVWHERMDLPLLRRLDGIHVTRPSEVESVRVTLARPAECLPWTLAPERSDLLPRPQGARPYLLFVGRLNAIKGLERLLDGVARTAPPLRLLLAGTGDRSYVAALSRRAAELHVRDRVEFLGQVEPDPLTRLYAEAEALVLPSHYENFGMVVLEALRVGCPVIASRETPWDFLEPSGAGRTIDFADPDALGRALESLREPGPREAASKGALSLFRRSFLPETVVPRYASWYEDVVRRRPGSSPS